MGVTMNSSIRLTLAESGGPVTSERLLDRGIGLSPFFGTEELEVAFDAHTVQGNDWAAPAHVQPVLLRSTDRPDRFRLAYLLLGIGRPKRTVQQAIAQSHVPWSSVGGSGHRIQVAYTDPRYRGLGLASSLLRLAGEIGLAIDPSAPQSPEFIRALRRAER